MVKGLILCNAGLEDVCEQEIQEILTCKCDVKEGYIIIDVDNVEDLCKLSYKSQSANRVCLLMGKINTLDTCKDIIDNKSICVRAMEFEDNSAKARELAKHICDALDKDEVKYEVNLKRPTINILAINIEEDPFIAIDISGEINKRDYLVFSHNQTLRSTVAYSLVRLSGYTNEGQLLDPFCGGGTIPIEAALNNHKGIHYYDFEDMPFNKFIKGIEFEENKKEDKSKLTAYDITLNTVTSARKNAKIGGVNKNIDFSCVDAQFLDMKFDENTVDYIITHPPLLSKGTNEKKVLKLWDEFLFIAQDILIKKMVVITNDGNRFREIAEENKLKCVEQREIYQGKTKLYVLIFEK